MKDVDALFEQVEALVGDADPDVLMALSARLREAAAQREQAARAAVIEALVKSVPTGTPATLLRWMLVERGESGAGYLASRLGLRLEEIEAALRVLEPLGRVSVRHGAWEALWPVDEETGARPPGPAVWPKYFIIELRKQAQPALIGPIRDGNERRGRALEMADEGADVLWLDVHVGGNAYVGKHFRD